MAVEKYLDDTGLEHILRKQKPTAVPIPSDPSQLTFKYTGQVIKPTFPGIDSNLVVIDCPDSINVGTYTARMKLKNTVKTCWSDGTTYDKDINYQITKADGTMTINKNSATLTAGTPSTTVTCSNVKGTITVQTSDSSTVTASVNGNTVTITAKGYGNATITITDGGNELYNAISRTVSITSQYYKIVSWTNGTDKEIVDIVKAAKAGLVNLKTQASWAVGDTRTIAGVGIKLLDFDNEEYNAKVVVGSMAIGLLTDRFQSNAFYPDQPTRSKALEYYNSIPSSIKGIFKQTTFKYAKGDYASGSVTDFAAAYSYFSDLNISDDNKKLEYFNTVANIAELYSNVSNADRYATRDSFSAYKTYCFRRDSNTVVYTNSGITSSTYAVMLCI